MAAEQPSLIQMLLPFILMLPIFYFLVIRPQANRAKNHEAFLKELKRGDEIITASGILGRIEGITDTVVTLEVGENARMKVLKKQIAGSQASFFKESTNSGTKK